MLIAYSTIIRPSLRCADIEGRRSAFAELRGDMEHKNIYRFGNFYYY